MAGATSSDVVILLITAISVELDHKMIASDATNVNRSTTVSSPLERLSVEKLRQRTISTHVNTCTV